ncbi:MAG: response regulator transcription factor [Bulleidia sp.]
MVEVVATSSLRKEDISIFHILLAEDDTNLRNVVEKTLCNAGYTVVAVADGNTAYEKFCSERFALVITDIMMPFMDGNELTAEIRKLSEDTPILMLTAVEAIDDKEKGFNMGADDYLVKPLFLKELALRIKALLRRYKAVSEEKIVLPHTELNFNTNTAVINGQNVELTKKEFLLLFKLLSNPNIIFSREQLINEIWGYDSESSDRTVDTHIKWLRDKTDNEDFKIVTVRGLGYKAVLL